MLWKIITSHPEFEISENGDVRKIGTNTCRKVQDNGKGYKLVQFRKSGTKPKNEYIHRMVALAFIGEPPSDQHVVAHNDGNRANNTYSNLRWDTVAGNLSDRVLHGTSNDGEKNPMAKLTLVQVQAIRSDPRPAKEVAAEYGIAQHHVYRVRSGTRWSKAA